MSQRVAVLMLPFVLGTGMAWAQSIGTFTDAGHMAASRRSHTATVLPDGRVLIAGGHSGLPVDRKISRAELYDPSTGTFAATGDLTTPRAFHTATLLSDGRVLIAGGQNDHPPYQTVGSAELYDLSTGKFTTTGTMVAARVYHTAVLLGSGKVLIISGAEFRGKGATIDLRAELYDPTSGTFAATGTPVSINPPTGDEYVSPTATLLQDGRVLVTWTSTLAELYDPRAGTFSPTGSMIASRGYEAGTQTLLANGTVLVAGGSDFGAIDSAELYDPSTGTFRLTGKMTTRRARHTATLLRDGTVLITGANQEGFVALVSTELYDPDTGTFSERESLATARYWHTGTLLDNGKVLFAGGYVSVPSSTTSSAELYTSASLAAPLPVFPLSGNKVTLMVPARPSGVVATASGSGVVLTWMGPPGATPVRYAISGGTAPHTSTLPVIVTADASNRYTIPALPPGPYYFTVFAILADGLSPPSDEAAVVASGSQWASGPPSGALAVIEGGYITATWTPAPGVGALYEVEIGRGPGQADAAVLTTTQPSVTYRADAARSYLRVREVRGATVSAPSNDVSVSAATVCTAAPLGPVLLPASTINGETTFSWLSAGGPPPARYRVDVTGPADPMSMISRGSGTSLTAALKPGEYSIRVTAVNACGTSAVSNLITFSYRI